MALSADPRLHRSYLYAPGSNPDVMDKALAAGADAVVLDLEDSVASSAKAAARESVSALLGRLGGPDRRGSDIHVRINVTDGAPDHEDLELVVQPGLAAIRVPKVESGDLVTAVAEALDQLEAAAGIPVGSIGIYPTIESALGVVQLAEICCASHRIVRCALGASDLLADLGASGDDATATLYARSALVVHSRAAGIGPPVDSVHTDLGDDRGLRAAATRARSLGFNGKSVIHPRQLATVHEVFTPDADQLESARRIVAASGDATERGVGATRLGDTFIDPAIVARARALLALAGDDGPAGDTLDQPEQRDKQPEG